MFECEANLGEGYWLSVFTGPELVHLIENGIDWVPLNPFSLTSLFVFATFKKIN